MEANAGGSVTSAVGGDQIKPRDEVKDSVADPHDLKDLE